MRYLVTGAGGQLGRAVCDHAGDAAVGFSRAQLDVDDADAVRKAIADSGAESVIHCGAWTNVDGCEDDPERADRINGRGTAHVAEACRALGVRLVYVSTDFVFDGEGSEPYAVDAPTAPLSAYGRSKLLGERAVLRDGGGAPGFWVVRTSWVFGPGGKNFPRAILNRAESGQPLAVIDDQIGSPTFTQDLAPALCELADSDAPGGVFHASNAGVCSWWDFAVDVVRAAGFDGLEIARIKTESLNQKARRPRYSALDCARLAELRGTPLPDYSDAVRRYVAIEKQT